MLIALAAGALVCALALAWAQVQSKLALGDPVRLQDTPLTVRPPAGWIGHPPGSGVFVKPVRKMAWGREVWAAERKVEISYNDFFLQLTRLFQAASLSPGKPAEIAGWRGAQWELTQGGKRWEEQSLFRWVAAPWGGQLTVEYTPLGEASFGDERLMDAVCNAIQVDGGDLVYDRKETLDYAGVSFESEKDWELLGPEDMGGPGLCLEDAESDPPRWALALFRRSMPGGMPKDVLVNEAVHAPGAFTAPVESLRDDRVYVAVTSNREDTPGGSPIVSIRVVAESHDRVAVIYALASTGDAGLANEAAAKLVKRLEFVSDYPPYTLPSRRP